MIRCQVRFCPSGERTLDLDRSFAVLPRRGESIVSEGERYVVVEIDWQDDGTPFLIAHSANRPRAREALRWGSG